MMPKSLRFYTYTTADCLNSIIENTIDILMATIASISLAFSIDSALSLGGISGVGRIHLCKLRIAILITKSKMALSATNTQR